MSGITIPKPSLNEPILTPIEFSKQVSPYVIDSLLSSYSGGDPDKLLEFVLRRESEPAFCAKIRSDVFLIIKTMYGHYQNEYFGQLQESHDNAP